MRWAATLSVAVLMIVSCSPGEPAPEETSDGELDCREGLVVVGADIVASGDSEEEVIRKSLSVWIDEGGEIAGPFAEYWSVVIDGREVARTLPEQSGDGSWVSHDVQSCGEPDTGLAAIDGELDCATDVVWIAQGGRDPDSLGTATAEEATQFIWEQQAIHGGDVIQSSETTWSLVVDLREQVVYSVREEETGWFVTRISGCEGFEL